MKNPYAETHIKSKNKHKVHPGFQIQLWLLNTKQFEQNT